MNSSIREYLINIYDKLSHKSTLLNGIALFRYLIKKEFYSVEKCNYIIKEILEQTNKLNGEDKKECLILLPYFFINQTSLKYIKKILNILFVQINHTTENIFPNMAKIYGDIFLNVQNLDSPRKAANLMGEKKNEYENILLKFCLDLIDNEKNDNDFMFKNKHHDFSLNIYQQKCGFIFLEQFIINYKNLSNDNIILNIILNILKSHFELLKNKNFIPKIELLRCINKLINKIKHKFSSNAKILVDNIINAFDKTLSYSGMDFKINRDLDFKKYLFDIFYSLLLYNKEDINEDLDKILSYAKINKINMNKEIRSISLKIINLITSKNIQGLYNTNKISNNTNYNYNTNIYINNYLSNDNLNRNKERALSFKSVKTRESQIKRMIEEDKRKYGDKKQNKNFIFVSQSPKKDLNYSGSNPSFRKDYKNEINKNNKNNLKVLNKKVYEINNMNNSMINTMNNIEKYLNNNFNSMELKLNKIENLEEIFNDKKNLLDEKIENIILKDEELINFVEQIDEKDINNISMKNYEEIINRFMILLLVNKNSNFFERYMRLLNKLLNCKIIKFDDDEEGIKKNYNYQKYKISYNLENNLQYLFKSLNI